MKSEPPRRACPRCGQPLAGALDLCPVCMLRQAAAGSSAAEPGPPEAVDDTREETLEDAY